MIEKRKKLTEVSKKPKYYSQVTKSKQNCNINLTKTAHKKRQKKNKKLP